MLGQALEPVDGRPAERERVARERVELDAFGFVSHAGESTLVLQEETKNRPRGRGGRPRRGLPSNHDLEAALDARGPVLVRRADPRLPRRGPCRGRRQTGRQGWACRTAL